MIFYLPYLILIYFSSSHADGSIKFWDASASKFYVSPSITENTQLLFIHSHSLLFSLNS